VIRQSSFATEPWRIRETELHRDILCQTESVFALSNGHIGVRGNLDEGEPYGLPGSYLNGFYELHPMPYAEAGYGFPESGQTVINVTDGKVFRLLVDDEPFDVRYGDLDRHERVLDFRRGVLERSVRWRSPAGPMVEISSVRMVSFTQRAIVAACYEVRPVDQRVHVVVQSEMVANEPVPALPGDPRVAAVLEAPLVAEEHGAQGERAVLVHSTRSSGLRVAAGMDHLVDSASPTDLLAESFPDAARVAFTTVLEPGQRLRVVKLLAYGWSGQRSVPALRDQVAASLLAARQTGWDGLLEEQRTYLDDFWARADVEVHGDPRLQQAVRFGLFHVLQAGARGERRGIPAKGLTGTGYDGHCFWDTETFVLPVLSYTVPDAAADELRWRQTTLPLAMDRARQLGLEGATFPWRTIAGEECSGYWPAGTAAFHVNADIADAVIRYVKLSGDTVFERDTGCELLVQTARLWRSLGHHQPGGAFRIDGVTGPDEYSALADNNVYTNLMAQRNLRAAAEVIERYPDQAAALGVSLDEAAGWRDAAAAMMIPYDDDLGVHPQSENFTRHAVWDFSATQPDQYPLLLHFPYFDLYRKQVVKQADLVLALHLCGQAFSREEKARDFAYYEPVTVRDSSLSACTQAVIAAEVGHLQLAMGYLREAALMDLDDLERNTRDGLHLAALAGSWIALVAGFGGLRDHDGVTFAPRLPEELQRLAFNISVRGRCLRIEVVDGAATYLLRNGEPMELAHHGESFTLSSDKPVTLTIPDLPPPGPTPSQPPGREPGILREPTV